MQHIHTLSRISAVFAGLMVVSPLVQAASQCKGLPQESCSADPACTWVNAYTRKDGRQVSAYCRNAPGKKVERQSSTPSAEPKTGAKQG
jgi:hypothetical protein